MTHQDPLFDVAGKVCLITGASDGLGAAFARGLIARGARVVNLSLAPPSWQFDAAALLDVRADVTDEAALDRAIKAAIERFGGLDVLVNNAGAAHVRKASRMDEKELRQTFDVNLMAVANACRLARRAMVRTKTHGSIINVSSVLAERPVKGLSAYGASKAALEALSRALAAEWAADGVRVNVLAPGWFKTGMTSSYFDKGVRGYIEQRVPMGRLGEEGDLLGALVLLASDASRYMTGTTLHVDGGYLVG